MSRPPALRLFVFSFLFFGAQLFGVDLVHAAILSPYEVDEKPQVLFGDSVTVEGYRGLENYQYEYRDGYLHISFTYTHHQCCTARFPPRVYVTDQDPRATSSPTVKSLDAVYPLSATTHVISHTTNWYLYDVQFDSLGYTVIVLRGGEVELINEHRLIDSLQDSDWVALANQYPGPNVVHSMAFVPLPIREGPLCAENCFSNVLFLPGLKGSVLKSGADTLWPPAVLSNDVPQLALTEGGESVNDVVVDSILNTFYGTPIYNGFSTFMESLVANGTINEWKPLPYDWRFGPEQAVENGIKTPGGVVDVIETVEALAANSKSGQVVIVAHSMGGLLGKTIIKELEEQGKDNLIDAFVMVGVPQLGTPQAAAALLHGDDEGIAGGFIVNPTVVRAMAQNMPGPHTLLPSTRYFAEVIDPPVIFDDVSFTEAWRAYWGETLESFAEFNEFLAGLGVPRPEPPVNNLHIPEVLRGDLVADAAAFHTEYDNYVFPEDTRVVQVAGWGVPTTKSLEYTTRHLLQSYKPAFTIEGDSTVVYPSAISSIGGEVYYFYLEDYRISEISNAQHRDLLNHPPVQEFLHSVLAEGEVLETQYISEIKPETSVVNKLVVSTHSPVILGAYDSLGNFTGINPNQNLSAEILTITEDIPGSSFRTFGESQYIFLPKEGSYTFVFQGVGEGPTTVEIEEFANDITTPIVTYSDIPVTASTKASFVVDSSALEETEVEVDKDGDGEVDDIVVADGTELTLEELMALLKEQIQELDIKNKLKKKLLKKVEKLEKKIAKQKKKKSSKVVMNLGKKVMKKGQKGRISDSEAEEILDLLEEIESKL